MSLCLPIVADDVGIIKFHVSTAIRAAITTHVAEILRDVGPKVTSCPSFTWQLPPILCYIGKACHGNCRAHQGSQQKVGYVVPRSIRRIPGNNVPSSRPPPACNELYIHRGVPGCVC